VINALKALLALDGELPVNVKLCIDGEEECGSASLASLLEYKKEDLAADYLIVADGGFGKPDSPAVNLGARGLVTMTVEVIGSKSDLHSGAHGGLVYNPNHALVEILAKLRNKAGQITVPGFYDQVLEPTAEEKEKLNLRFDAERYEFNFGAKPIGGEKDYSPLESNLIRPTLEINGLCGGYTGTGFKTVIPARAEAKISCRLVPDQDPSRIGELVSGYLRSNAPEGLDLEIRVSRGSKAFRTTSESRIVRAVVGAYNEFHDIPCRFHLGGGTIPIAAELVRISGAEVVLMGYGLGQDNVHAPNEHFGLDRLKKGFLTIARSLERIAE
jgi:acetylornithine deacetylase/succinyl-diaminopimelate desuccinylase-like protein